MTTEQKIGIQIPYSELSLAVLGGNMVQGLLRVSEASNLAIHALAHLAGLEPGASAAANQIAAALRVSESHLGKVLQRLVKCGYLRSSRGAHGGFSLVEETREATLLELLEALDGPVTAGGCLLGTPVCRGPCRLRPLNELIARTVRDQLGALRLGEVAQGFEPGTDLGSTSSDQAAEVEA